MAGFAHRLDVQGYIRVQRFQEQRRVIIVLVGDILVPLLCFGRHSCHLWQL